MMLISDRILLSTFPIHYCGQSVNDRRRLLDVNEHTRTLFAYRYVLSSIPLYSGYLHSHTCVAHPLVGGYPSCHLFIPLPTRPSRGTWPLFSERIVG